MSARFLDDEARAAFKRAIEAIENASAVEVVVAVRRRSHGYRHANVAVGALVAFVGLAVMLYAEHSFALSSILIDPFVVGFATGLLVEVLPDLKRILTPRARRRMHAMRAARTTFVERGVHGTTGRSGLLVYISWLEREVALVPDLGLSRALPAEALARMERELAAAMGTGARVANTLAGYAGELGRAMPHGADDVNELPDAIDSDLGRA